MCANTDKAMKYYQDATIGNATQKGYCNQFFTLRPSMTTTQERNHKHRDPI